MNQRAAAAALLVCFAYGCGSDDAGSKSGASGNMNNPGAGGSDVGGSGASSIGSGGASSGALDVDCSAFIVTGDPTDSMGATWTYASSDSGTEYRLEGMIFTPAGDGPFPGVMANHGKGSSPSKYSTLVAKTLATWNVVVLVPMYTHAVGEDEGNLPAGDEGASEANVLRAHKTHDLFSCLPSVDLTRLAVHGHSMGAYLTGQLLGTYPNDFKVASHTAGGVSIGPYATKADVAALITTPYQLHHGDADTVVLLEYDQTLDGILTDHGVDHELNIYPGYDHGTMSNDAEMLDKVKAWYEAHDLWP